MDDLLQTPPHAVDVRSDLHQIKITRTRPFQSGVGLAALMTLELLLIVALVWGGTLGILLMPLVPLLGVLMAVLWSRGQTGHRELLTLEANKLRSGEKDPILLHDVRAIYQHGGAVALDLVDDRTVRLWSGGEKEQLAWLEDLLKQNTDRIRERAADESHIPARLKAMRQKAKP